MKKYYFTHILIILKFVICGQIKGQNKESDLVIKNVSVITMKSNEIIKNQDVVMKEGKIISISNTGKTEYKNELDGTDKYLMPSLADAHVHFPETETEMERMMQLYLINGVTKLRSMRGNWNHLDWQNKYNTAPSIVP